MVEFYDDQKKGLESREWRKESSEGGKRRFGAEFGSFRGVSCRGRPFDFAKNAPLRGQRELMCPKMGLFFAILGLFLQTKGGFEEQLGAWKKGREEKLSPQSHGGAAQDKRSQSRGRTPRDRRNTKDLIRIDNDFYNYLRP